MGDYIILMLLIENGVITLEEAKKAEESMRKVDKDLCLLKNRKDILTEEVFEAFSKYFGETK